MLYFPIKNGTGDTSDMALQIKNIYLHVHKRFLFVCPTVPPDR